MEFNRLRIGTRLGWGFGVLLLLLCGLASTAWTQMGSLASNTAFYAENLVPSFEVEYEVSTAMGAIRRLESQHLLVDTRAEMQEIEQRLAEQQKHLHQSLEHYEKTLVADDEDRRNLNAVKAAVTAYGDVWPRMRELSLRAHEDPAIHDQAKAMLFGPSREAYRNAEKAFETWRAYNVKLAAEQKSAAQTTYAEARWILLAGCAFALALGALAAVLITRSITGPVARAVQAAEAVAAGDLTTRIQVLGQDEMGKLLQALAHMSERLRALVSQVRNGSEAIATGSSQIAAGSVDLSQRTEKQAASLEETAASMEQLNATVKHNADTAQQATRLATAASTAAEQGGAIVNQVVATMEDITASSRKIADITSVIDGIAFQTNILALNAAVEAARAGEQGRGFAVVAGEVRTLAQRSAEAAREIKDLINTSAEKVEAGSTLVNEAGSGMEDLVQQVQRVSSLINEISSASVEQTDGLTQVSVAVSQLDEVTQHNAALVEQSSAAADSLSQQAQRLVQAVSVFRL